MHRIEIRRNRIYYLIPVPFLLLLMYVFYWLLYGRNEDIRASLGYDWYIISHAVLLAGAFLLVYFTRQFFRNPVIMRVDDRGFEYNPAGVSSGFIPWSEVKDIREIDVLVKKTRTARYETALGIVLKNPELYRGRYNKLVSKLLQLNEGLYDASLLISPDSLGKKYDSIKSAMMEKISYNGNEV